MPGSRFQLAQINIARMVAPPTDPVMSEFVANLAPINALAEAARGSSGVSRRTRRCHGRAARDDDRVIINFSIWEDVRSLRNFVYHSAHAGIMKRRQEWFARLTDAYVALWWVPALRPTVAEAVARMQRLRLHGASSEAFTFLEPYPAPDAPVSEVLGKRD